MGGRIRVARPEELEAGNGTTPISSFEKGNWSSPGE